MMSNNTTKWFLATIRAGVVVLILSLPNPVYAADPIMSFMQAIMGGGMSFGNSGQFVNGDPANQVIPLLQQIYRQNADNGGVDNNGKRLQTRTSMQIADYQEQNQWERERRLRNDDISRRRPEMSNLACAIATVSQSAPLIDVAAANARGQVAQLITGGMYRSVLLATEISDKNKALIWCKLGSTGIRGRCKVEYDLLTKGAEESHTNAITIKDSIPCDMPGVIQEFQQMRNPESWNPNPRHKECVAAILSIANEFPISDSLPTEEEVSTVNGTRLEGQKIHDIADAASAKGAVYEKFEDRVSVAESSASGCMTGIRGGGTDMYTLLQTAYGDATRASGKAPFGLPPSGFCLSKLQYRKGELLLMEKNLQENAGRTTSAEAALQNVNATLVALFRTQNDAIVEQVGGVSSHGSEGIISGKADRRVRTTNNHDQELLGAIRQLTHEIKKMNSGVYSDKIQEVSVKKGTKLRAPVITSPVPSEVVSDALKEMGIKVSAPAFSAGGVLEPISQEFPVLPPQ